MFKKLPEAISKTIKPLGYESDAPVGTGAKVIVKKSKEELLAEDDYIPYEFVKDDDNNIIYCDDQTIFTNSELASINFYFDANGIKVGTTASIRFLTSMCPVLLLLSISNTSTALGTGTIHLLSLLR